MTQVPNFRFRVLGPLAVERNGVRVEVSALRQRVVLGVLLADVGRPISIGRLVDVLWPGEAPRTARITLQNYVKRLRLCLGDHAKELVVTHANGYSLAVDPESTDWGRYRSLAARARSRAVEGKYDEVCDLYERAARLWVGAPFEDLTAVGFLSSEADWLSEQHVQGLEQWAGVAVSVGRSREVIPFLQAEVARDPLSEPLQAALVRCQVAAGRTAEALDQYRNARLVFKRDLGVEPGALLKSAHAAALGRSAGSEDVAYRVKPAQLPLGPRRFVSRADELGALDRLLQGPTAGGSHAAAVAVISGPAGVGKTSLALAWSHRVKRRFPDGQLYANMQAFGARAVPLEVSEVLGDFIFALSGVQPSGSLSDRARVALFRSLVADKRVLIVLDDVADVAELASLMPATSGCVAVATSRNRLHSFAAATEATQFTLGRFSVLETAKYVESRVAEHTTDRQVDFSAEGLHEVTQGLPLALSVATSVALTKGLSHLGQQAIFDVGALLDGTVRHLGESTQSFLKHLGLHPGRTFTIAAASSLAGISYDLAQTHLDALHRFHLVDEVTPGRYGMHSEVRRFAMDFAEKLEDAERVSSIRRLIDHYGLALDERVFRYLHDWVADPRAIGEVLGDPEERSRWATAEYEAVKFLVQFAAETPEAYPNAWRLVGLAYRRLFDVGRLNELARLVQTARTLTLVHADRVGEAMCLLWLGDMATYTGDYTLARASLLRSLSLHEERGDLPAQVLCHSRLLALYDRSGQLDSALAHSDRLLELSPLTGDPDLQQQAYNNAGWLKALKGDLVAAVKLCARSLLIQEESRLHGSPRGTTLDSLGYIFYRLGDYEQSVACYQDCVTELRHKPTSRLQLAEALVHLGCAQFAQGVDDAYRSSWREAIGLLERFSGGKALVLRDAISQAVNAPELSTADTEAFLVPARQPEISRESVGA